MLGHSYQKIIIWILRIIWLRLLFEDTGAIRNGVSAPYFTLCNREFSYEAILDLSKPVVTVSGIGGWTSKQATPLKCNIIWQKEQNF